MVLAVLPRRPAGKPALRAGTQHQTKHALRRGGSRPSGRAGHLVQPAIPAGQSDSRAGRPAFVVAVEPVTRRHQTHVGEQRRRVFAQGLSSTRTGNPPAAPVPGWWSTHLAVKPFSGLTANPPPPP